LAKRSNILCFAFCTVLVSKRNNYSADELQDRNNNRLTEDHTMSRTSKREVFFKLTTLITTFVFLMAVGYSNAAYAAPNPPAQQGQNPAFQEDPDGRECWHAYVPPGTSVTLRSGRLCVADLNGHKTVKYLGQSYAIIGDRNQKPQQEIVIDQFKPLPVLVPNPAQPPPDGEEPDDGSVWDWLGPVLITAGILSFGGVLIWAAETCKFHPCNEHVWPR
jgi:hypothetical protein